MAFHRDSCSMVKVIERNNDAVLIEFKDGNAIWVDESDIEEQ